MCHPKNSSCTSAVFEQWMIISLSTSVRISFRRLMLQKMLLISTDVLRLCSSINQSDYYHLLSSFSIFHVVFSIKTINFGWIPFWRLDRTLKLITMTFQCFRRLSGVCCVARHVFKAWLFPHEGQDLSVFFILRCLVRLLEYENHVTQFTNSLLSHVVNDQVERMWFFLGETYITELP